MSLTQHTWERFRDVFQAGCGNTRGEFPLFLLGLCCVQEHNLNLESDYQLEADVVGSVQVPPSLSVTLFLPLFPLVSSSEHTSLLSFCPSGRINVRSSPPPIKRCVPPASTVNDFISKTWAGSDPLCHICSLCSLMRLVVLQPVQIMVLCLIVCPVFSWNLNPRWFHFSPLVRSDPCFGQICACEWENVREGEEKGHTNMRGARAHFACELSEHFLFYPITFCHLRLFLLLDFFTPVWP